MSPCLFTEVSLLALQSIVSRLKDNVDDHKQYDEALDSAGRWLAAMSERVAACSDTSGDWHVIQDRIEEIKVRPVSSGDDDDDGGDGIYIADGDNDSDLQMPPKSM